MIDTFTSKMGVSSLKVGGGILSVLEAAAQNDIKQSQNVFNALLSKDLDSSDTAGLDRIGQDEKIPRIAPAKARGDVTITDTSFVKLSTRVYAGGYAPIVGSMSVLVDDTTSWPASGEVYIGRNTANLEGPIVYSSITDFGSYKRLNFSTATTKFHNRGESVIVSQGGIRTIGQGVTVTTKLTSLSSSLTFKTVFQTVILDGETTVTGVEVVALQVGEASNIAAEDISSFGSTEPFPGATVTNPLPFVNGRDVETNNDYIQRIREVRASRIRGTDQSIKHAILGITASDESKRVSSVSMNRFVNKPSVVVVDDGSGYEPISKGVGIETIESSASGGEKYFQTVDRPIERAQVKSGNQSPFEIAEGAILSVTVGGITTVHNFEENLAASAYDIVSSINANPQLNWSARTADGGLSVCIFSKNEENDDIKVNDVDGINSNDVFAFNTATQYTTLLYKNDRLLSKDGKTASLRSKQFANWNAMSGSQTIVVAVDQTPSATYTFTDQDFVDASTGFVAIGKNSLAAWVTVINKKIPGITAVVESDYILLTSNAGRSGSAGIYISGGTLISNSMFSAGSSQGQAFDYSLDRGVGQIELQTPLLSDDSLSLGTVWTRGFLESSVIPITNLITQISLWFAVDANPYIVPHGVSIGTNLTASVVRVNNNSNHVQITATSPSAEAFKNVAPGDWLVLSDQNTNLPNSLRNSWRVVDVTKDGSNLLNEIVIEKPQMKAARIGGAAAAFSSGTLILVTGGYTSTTVTPASLQYGNTITNECEIYNPTTGVWTTTGPMITARAHHTLSILPDGRLIAVGGYGTSGAVLASTEIFDPNTNLWTAGPNLAVARAEHTATVLVSNRVLIAGGVSVTGTTATATAVEYNQGTNTFINPSTMGTARAAHGACVILAGGEADKVFFTGGRNSTLTGDLTSTEMYDPGAFTWTARAALTNAMSYHGATASSSDKVLVVKGTQWQEYSATGNSWGALATVEANWKFNDNKRQSLVRYSDTQIIAYGGFFDDPLPWQKRIRHKIFNNSNTPPWSTLADSNYTQANDRSSLMSVVIGTRVWFGGGLAHNRDVYTPVATGEFWNSSGSVWTAPDDATALNGLPLPNKGIAFVRMTNDIHRVTIPAASGYSAPAYVDLLESGLDGITASVYKTTKIRIETNSYDTGRDISLVASTDSSFPLAIETQDSLTGHLASVESALGIGTPHDFTVFEVAGKADTSHTPDTAQTYHFPYTPSNSFSLPPSTSIVSGLRRVSAGLVPDYWQYTWTAGNELRTNQYGNTKSKAVTVGAQSAITDRLIVGVRDDIPQPLAPLASVVFAHPFAISPRDNLSVLVNGDNEQGRFPINMWRRLKPANSVYGASVEMADYDAGDVPLITTFGQTYDFDDFAVYMKARAKSHTADANMSALWRFYRHGPEGNLVSVRYLYPDGPEAEIDVSSEQVQASPLTSFSDGTARAFANVILGSGEAKDGSSIETTSKLTVARCNETTGVWDVYVIAGFDVVYASRPTAGGSTIIRIQVPNNGVVAQGPQASGLQVNDVVWFEAANPSPTTLFSGSFTISAAGAFNAGTGQQDIGIPAGALDDGTTAIDPPVSTAWGTLSNDSTTETSFDDTVVVDDLCRLKGSQFPSDYVDTTMRIAARGKQYLRCRAYSTYGIDNTPSAPWYTMTNPTNDISLFGGPTANTTAVVAAVNALHGDGLKSAVSGTVIGTGTGIINRATWDELDNILGRYDLTDGINYVQRTIDPVLLVDHTEFLFKDPVSAGLLTDSDWLNEDVRIVPVTVKNVSDWLATPAVSGLSTFAEITDSDDGRRVQIAAGLGSEGSVEVQGGGANAATAAIYGSPTFIYRGGGGVSSFYSTIKRGESDAFVGGRWCVVNNSTPVLKSPAFINFLASATVSATGVWTTSGPASSPFTLVHNIDETRAEFEKVGNFVAVRIPRNANTSVPSSAEENGYLYLYTSTLNRSDLPHTSSPNKGLYRIVRVSSNLSEVTIWIENPNAIEEKSVCKLKVVSENSTIPGDVWQVSNDLFGTGNKGSWTVTEVGTSTPGGEMFVSGTQTFTVDVSQRPPEVVSVPVGFGETTFNQFKLREGVPARYFKKVVCVMPSSDDPEYAHIQFSNSSGSQNFSAAAGSIITALDKLNFPLGTKSGSDGYKYNTGLVGEANRVIYGDQDGNRYSGYAASGARISITGPLVKRTKVALSIRAANGLPTRNIASQVKSAVASVVNKSPAGINLAISDIIGAVRMVSGVGAVSIVSPSYSSSSDVIKVSGMEKLLIIDIEKDVLVTFV